MHKAFIAIAATALAFPAQGWSATAQHSKHPHQTVAAQQPGQRLGTLSCEVNGGMGMIIGSNRGISCSFRQQGRKTERYTGSIGKLGLDIGISGKSYLSWVVVNTKPTRVGQGDLAGTYVGASADAAVGLGVGANALIGGNARNIVLQPLSGQTGTGLNIAAGVSRLQLAATRR
ncbi:DUF992 domain-containing protein [Rhizobium grahamii]|uniref:DUF992 domain-containing protein n=2 Tax=Rhizobium grahamii TaxID=1120045 RepID=S3HCW8_9HYPH|nr:hypothetical protein RGCCGE502_20325 [Rhizobium grahamii CCGE 502]RDJ03322.1 hypothetical protein B5K06_30485 [Rhizobium grahamii]